MSHWICCNSCFNANGSDRRLAVTNCGHIVCNVCFQRGKEGECIICQSKCQLSPLTDKSSPEVKSFFSDIGSVATKYFSELCKVLQFQARHQKKLLTHYQQRNEQLEQDLLKMKQELQQMAKKITEQNAYISKLQSTLQLQSSRVLSQSSQGSQSMALLKSASSETQIPYSSPLSLSRHFSTASLVEHMEVDRNLFQKPDISRSVPRLSVISPPQDGRMGTVPHRASVSLLPRSATVSRESQSSLKDVSRTKSPNLAYRRDASWETPVFKQPLAYRYPSMSSLRPLP